MPHPTDAIRTRLLPCLIALALAAGACGGGAGDGAAGPTASPVPSPTPQPIEVGGEPTASPDPRKANTNQVAPVTPAPVPPQATEAAGAVKALLDAIDREDYALQFTLTTGAARALIRVRDIIRQQNAAHEGQTDEQVTVSEPPAMTQSDAQRATVSVQATIRSTVSGPRGEVSSEAALTGPVTLQKQGDAWTVADFVYSGRPLGPEHFPVNKQQSLNGVRLELHTVLSYKRTTAAVVRLVNERPGTVELVIDGAVLVDAEGAEYAQTQVATESRTQTPAIFLGFPLVEGKPRALKLTVERNRTERWTYEVPL